MALTIEEQYSLARKILGLTKLQEADREDLIQEVIIALWEEKKEVNQGLLKIALRRRSLNMLRTNIRRRYPLSIDHSMENESSTPGSSNVLDSASLIDVLSHAGLSTEEWAIIDLWVEHMKQDEPGVIRRLLLREPGYLPSKTLKRVRKDLEEWGLGRVTRKRRISG